MNGISRGVLELGDREFDFFREAIYRESGIKLSDIKRALVQARLLKRLRELGFGDYREYSEYLSSNYDNEVVNLINCITTNKTEFFREPYHFEFLERVTLPQLEGKRIRIWSAGCSSGEEPYTIAITLLEHFGGSVPDCKILATDIDTRVLGAAISGIYSADAVSMIPPDLLRRYFLRKRSNNKTLYRIKERVQESVYFRRLNLLDEYLPMRKTFDIIFCRNVFIYFDNASKRKVLLHLHRYLADDGYLFMGHAETLSGANDLFYIEGKSVYRKVCRSVV